MIQLVSLSAGYQLFSTYLDNATTTEITEVLHVYKYNEHSTLRKDAHTRRCNNVKNIYHTSLSDYVQIENHTSCGTRSV